MASFQGRAVVLNAFCPPLAKSRTHNGSKISPVAQDAPSNIRAFQSVLALADDVDHGPAQKRRKVDNRRAVTVQQAGTEFIKSIALVSVLLDLNISASAQDDKSTKSLPPHGQESPLLFESFHVALPAAMRIILRNPSNMTAMEITATTDADFLQAIKPHFQNAASLSPGRTGRTVSRAAFCHCRIIPPTPQVHVYRLEVEIRWAMDLSVVEDPRVSAFHMKEDLKLLARYSRDADTQETTRWALSDFYDAVHVPPFDLQISPRIQHSLMETELYPFQRRAVDWLLRREGVAFSSTGALKPFTEAAPPSSFRKAQDAKGQPYHVSQLRGMICESPAQAKDNFLQDLRGGILAEEMGLGKTVELIALIANHQREIPEGHILDAYTGTSVKPSGATLIITPPSIVEQWESELHTHAPGLKVFHYKGLPLRSASKEAHKTATIDHLMRYDVVLTTYTVLSREIHHAIPPPDRLSRHGKRHERRVSPLVGISWWRVCLDEAQMVESGVSQAARVARMIPRCNAWAVSGTPLRKDVQDLLGLLLFLRCEHFTTNNAVWRQLDKASFKSIFQQIAIRHSKDMIRNELHLPPQKRIVMTVPFTAIEDQHYTELVRQMCDTCRVTSEGQPEEAGRDANDPDLIDCMREWLVRLRQTCLHANVGRRNRKALGAKNGALRTVHEVLEVMIEQNDTTWKSEAREMISNKIKMGHVMAHAGNIEDRARSALILYQEALNDTQKYVKTCKAELLSEQQHARESTLEQPQISRLAEVESDTNIGSESGDLGRIAVIRKSLRSYLELEHACKFFIATMYHQIKDKEAVSNPGSEEYHLHDKLEVSWYEQAKNIRHELLKDSKGKAQQQMAKVSSGKPFHQILIIRDLPGHGGIEARKIVEMMDNIGDYLNAQAKQIEIWRVKIVNILLLPLVDDDDKNEETTGQEYDNSLEAQDELYVYIMALRTIIADRNTAVHGLQDTLTEHEAKEAEKRARQRPDEAGGRGHAPELVIDVFHTRRKLQAGLEGGSLKGVVSSMRSLMTGLQWKADTGDARARAELDLVQNQFARISSIVTQQAKTITELEKEQEMFRGAMNQRLEYYRQFQHISDTVAKWKEQLDETLDDRAFKKFEKLHLGKKEVVAGLKTKHTYLTHLRSENQTEARPDCIICQDAIEIGVLTTCGHKYCKECIHTWWHQHRTCPLCKKRLTSSEFKDISFKPSEMKAHEETEHTHASHSTTTTTTTTQASPPDATDIAIYSDMSKTTMKEIKMIDLDGSYGTKVDSIARHLLWIRSNDPGAKSIIFSQFGDFLGVLREALQRWKIGVTSITDKNGIARFKADAGIEAFLLDAKSDSSGLNLVNATYVFLCEPLINAAIELQAIARVHRIGQKRATTVFMYLIEDTVEQAIYELSVKRRLDHMGRSDNSRDGDERDGVVTKGSTTTSTSADRETKLDQANSAELQAAPLKQLLRKKGDGEVVHEDDLWKCLFGKPRKVGKDGLGSEVGRHLRAEAAEGNLQNGERF